MRAVETMGAVEGKLESVLRRLRECCGVIAVRLLSEDEKKELLDLENRVEENIAFGMCKSLNKGLREALQMEFTAVMAIQASEFRYPHHPNVSMTCGDRVIGELIKDDGKLEELRKNPNNFFLWENFVVYVKKLPRGPEERGKMRIIYHPGEAVQLRGVPFVKASVFGTPSTEGDALIKRMLDIHSEDVVGTCLVGFSTNSHSQPSLSAIPLEAPFE